MKASWLTLALLISAAQSAYAGGPSPSVDPGARLPEGDAAREYWDLVAQLDSGHRFYARFLITNRGPGDRSAVAMGDLVDPDGRAIPFQNGRREGRWTLGEDARSLRIGSSRLDLSGPAARVEIDNDKRGFEVVLDFEPDTSSTSIFDAEGGPPAYCHRPRGRPARRAWAMRGKARTSGRRRGRGTSWRCRCVPPPRPPRLATSRRG